MMRHAGYSIKDRITHIDIRRCHINLCTQNLFSVFIFPFTHLFEQLKVFLYGAVAVWAYGGLADIAAELAELEEERTNLALLMGREAFERVREIVEAQPREKWAAFYGTIREAVCGGADFSGAPVTTVTGALGA